MKVLIAAMYLAAAGCLAGISINGKPLGPPAIGAPTTVGSETPAGSPAAVGATSTSGVPGTIPSFCGTLTGAPGGPSDPDYELRKLKAAYTNVDWLTANTNFIADGQVNWGNNGFRGNELNEGRAIATALCKFRGHPGIQREVGAMWEDSTV